MTQFPLGEEIMEAAMLDCNSFTIRRTYLEEGIRLSRSKKGFPEVRLGLDESHVPVRLGDARWRNPPTCKDDWVMRSKAIRVGAYPRLIEPNAGWKGVVIRVIARDLDLRAEPFAKNLNLNPGGEGPSVFVQRGSHNDRLAKDQLFCLEHGQHLFIIDQKAAVMSIICRNGVPVMRTATRNELISYVLGYGLGARGRRDVRWAMHTIRDLGAGNHPLLLRRLEVLESR